MAQALTTSESASVAPAGSARTAAEPPRPWRLLRSAPRTVWLLVAAHGLLLVCWSVLAPIYHAPDEPNHVDGAARIYEGLGWPAPSPSIYLTPNGLSSWVASPYDAGTAPLQLNPGTLPQAAAVPRSQRPAWNDLRATNPPPANNPVQLQQILTHPPLYYTLQAGVLRLAGGEGQRWDLLVGAMRLFSVLLMTPLPLFCWAAARAFTGNRRAALCAAIVPFAIPQLSFIGGVVNNDDALTSFSAVATVGIACVLRGNLSRRTSVFVGVSMGLALLTKSLAVVLPFLVIAAYLLAGLRSDEPEAGARRTWQRRLVRGDVLQPLALALGSAFVIGGWWYVFQRIRAGAFQPGVPGFPGGVQVADAEGWAGYAVQVVPIRFWGSIGWYEVNLPLRIAGTASVVLAALVIVALVRTRGFGGRLSVGLLLWPVLSTLTLLLLSSYGFYRHYDRVLGLQGRYMFLGIAALAAVVAAGVAGLPRQVQRWAPLGLLLAAAAMQAEVVHLVLNTWWVPDGGGLHDGWQAITAYAVWPPAALRVLFVLAALVAVGTAVAVVLRCRRPLSPQASA